MTYQVLARRWRPGGFDEVTGQEHVTTPLRNAIRSDRVPHAILLTGPRGVGKTTIARILARCLNCEKGPTDTPCGSCPSCAEIASGSSTDVQEIDAASRTSVDDVREIIESVRYAPSPGKHRIYVVDEVHMLSTAAFNALLKTLEEPPPRSLFVLATTNPEKIPFTVVSRCQRYDLRRIATPEIAARLREVAGSEGAPLSDAALLEVARAGDGSLRDALTLLDQVLAAGGDAASDERVAEVLDLIDRRLLLGIVGACVDGDPAAALEACRRADERGVEARRLGGELVRVLRDLVVLSVAPDQDALVDAADSDLDAMREVASRTDGTRLRRMFRALVRELEDVAWAPEPFAVLEMAVVRLATLPQDGDVASLIARLESLEKRLAGGSGPPRTGGGGSGAAKTSTHSRDAASAAGAAPRGRSSGSRSATGDPATPAPQATAEPVPPKPQATAEPVPPKPQATAEPAPPAPHATAEPVPPAPHATAEPVPLAPQATAEPIPPMPREATTAPAIAPERELRDEAAPPVAEEVPSDSATDIPAELLTAPPAGAPLAVVFERLRDLARTQNRGLFAVLDAGTLLGQRPGELRIALPEGMGARRLEGRRADLEAVCEKFFGQPTRVELELREATASNPRGGAADPEQARARRLEALDHPAVNAALDILGGEILEIRPLGDAR